MEAIRKTPRVLGVKDHNWPKRIVSIGAKNRNTQDSLAAALVQHSVIMAAPPFVAARVTPEMKTLLRVLAEREQITESALVRQLLETMLRSSAADGFPKLEALEKVSRDARLSVRLAPEDRILLNDRATARGMPSATYVSVLVRSHLRNLAPLPKEELLALKRSVAELGAIGRNLNQIARAANLGGKPSASGREDLKSMLRVAEGLRDHVKALLKANQISWEQGHAATTH
jgi:predicted DNA-binding protein